MQECVCVCVRVCVPLCAFLFLFGGKIFDEMFCAHFIYAYTQTQISTCIYYMHTYSWLKIYINLYMHTLTHSHAHTAPLCTYISWCVFKNEHRMTRRWTWMDMLLFWHGQHTHTSTPTYTHRHIYPGTIGSLEMNTSLKYSVMHNKSAHAIAFPTLLFIPLPPSTPFPLLQSWINKYCMLQPGIYITYLV